MGVLLVDGVLPSALQSLDAILTAVEASCYNKVPTYNDIMSSFNRQGHYVF